MGITEENKDLKMTELSKLMGLEWKKLDDEGKQKYKEMAQKDKERYAKEMENYTPPPSDVPDESTGKEENESSKTTKAKTAKKKKKKDPAAQKGKRGAYIFFCNDIRARITEENKDLKMTELSKLMGLEWKELDDEGKQKYKEMAKKDKE